MNRISKAKHHTADQKQSTEMTMFVSRTQARARTQTYFTQST